MPTSSPSPNADYADSEIDLTDVVPCDYCHVLAGQGCRTSKGKPARTHAARIAEWDSRPRQMHPYTVDVYLVGAEPYPCVICGKGRQEHPSPNVAAPLRRRRAGS